MKTLLHRLFLAILALGWTCGCEKSAAMSDAELESFVREHVKIGAPKKTAQEFLESQKWTHAYNSIESRFEARYDAGAKDGAVTRSGVGVRIYLDKNDSVARIEVVRMATGW